MESGVIVTGSGGQGIMLLGKAIARAGMIAGKKVTWFPSYGAEMRGGTANCTVILSDEMIGSPVLLTPDILIAMNSASAVRFQPQLKKHGTLFYDSSLIKAIDFRGDISLVGVPATRMADALGNTRAANMIMLGAFIAETGILNKTSFCKVPFFTHSSAQRTEEFNKKSIHEGIQYIENQKSRNF
jgi:2-oxoglutarate ferredoxin oxidoreductase subunit gamma